MLSETVLKTNISVGTQWLPNIINITHYLKSEDSMFVPASNCISWFAVLGTVCLATVIFNIIIIIIFAKQRRLQRKSTYLIIHLAIVDLLVGAMGLWSGYNFLMVSPCSHDLYNAWTNNLQSCWP